MPKKLSIKSFLKDSPPKQPRATRRAMLAADQDPDVPLLQRMLHRLQEAVAGKQITPAMANQALGTYADSLLGTRTPTLHFEKVRLW